MSARLASDHSKLESMKQEIFVKEIIVFMKRHTKFPVPGEEAKCIRLFLKHFSQYVHDEKRLKMCLSFVFSILEIFHSTDGDLIRKFLKACILRKLKEGRLLRVKQTPLALLGCFPNQDVYYQVVPGHRKIVSTDSFFYENYFLRDTVFMERVLRYGVRFHADDADLRSFQEEKLMSILQQTGLRMEEYTYSNEEEDELRTLMDDNYPTYCDRRRLFFIVMAIDIVSKKKLWRNDEHHKTLIENFKMMFKTIQDSLITVAEMNRLFDIALKNQNNESKIRDFCSVFVEMFPRSAEPFRPRNLQHLCRCQIRESLAQTQKLPHGVSSLNLPNLLENYILLQNTEDEEKEPLIEIFTPRKRHTSIYNTRSSTIQKRPRFQ